MLTFLKINIKSKVIEGKKGLDVIAMTRKLIFIVYVLSVTDDSLQTNCEI